MKTRPACASERPEGCSQCLLSFSCRARQGQKPGFSWLPVALAVTVVLAAVWGQAIL